MSIINITDMRAKEHKFEQLPIESFFIPVGQSVLHYKTGFNAAVIFRTGSISVMLNVNPCLAITPVNAELAIKILG